MNTVEDQLRDTLRHRATLPRLGDDVAGTAIRGARTRQRRRLAVAAAVVVLAATIAGVSVAGGPSAAPAPIAPPPASPSPTGNAAQRHGVNLDVLDGQDLFTLDGRHHTVASGNPVYIGRVPAGWLYGSWDKPASLLRADGTTVTLTDLHLSQGGLERPNGPAVSADGRMVAWVNGTALHSAELTTSGLANMVSSPVPTDSFAMSWIGHLAVVGHEYGPACCGSNKAEYDVWDPARGNFVPHWTRDIYPVAGPVPGGVPAYVRVQVDTTDSGCLVRVDGVASMALTSENGCPPGFHFASNEAMLSPDGRYLVDYDYTHSGMVVYTLLDVASKTTATSTCPGGDSPMAWENATTYLVRDQATNQIFRCQVGSDRADPLLPEAAAITGWQPIPRYGV
jgi:hypothetical protein